MIMSGPSGYTPLLGLRGFPPSGQFLWRTGALFGEAAFRPDVLNKS
jgi:hypothetical protein